MRYFKIVFVKRKDGTVSYEVAEKDRDSSLWRSHGIFYFRDAAEKYAKSRGTLLPAHFNTTETEQ